MLSKGFSLTRKIDGMLTLDPSENDTELAEWTIQRTISTESVPSIGSPLKWCDIPDPFHRELPVLSESMVMERITKSEKKNSW